MESEDIYSGGVDSHFDDCYTYDIETLEKTKKDDDNAERE
jgi:hypothetical protein